MTWMLAVGAQTRSIPAVIPSRDSGRPAMSKVDAPVANRDLRIADHRGAKLGMDLAGQRIERARDRVAIRRQRQRRIGGIADAERREAACDAALVGSPRDRQNSGIPRATSASTALSALCL